MKVQDESFFRSTITMLRSLNDDTKPQWGSMTPQHMVEHLVGSWRVSNGNAKVQAIFQGDDLVKRRDFLFSALPYEKNIPNPVFRNGLQPLRKPSLTSAIDQLELEMDCFFSYYKAQPEATAVHPVFGELDFNGWLLFQTKHMQHHLEQFNLPS
jgi:hypothetical protein